MMRLSSPLRQKGSAIITALFLVTLVTIIATAMSARLQLDIYRAGLINTTDKLFLASQVITFWAMDRLGDPKQAFVNLDSRGKALDFPAKLSGIYPGVITQGAIYDLQARYNLNNVDDATFLPMYLGLLEQALPDTDTQTRIKIIDATVNWIQGPSKSHVGHDEWLDQYLKQKPVYFPAYQNMQHASELRMVFGMKAAFYNALRPYITALPEVTPINLNTAPIELLRSLGDGVSEHDAQEIIALRRQKPITNLAELGPLLEKINVPPAQITLTSQYFLAVAKTRLEDHEFTHYALLKRSTTKKGKISITILNECTDDEFLLGS